MKLHTSLITHVVDTAGKKVFEFPSGTVLDRIPEDVWPIIMQYINKYDGCLMGIGHYHGIYKGYQIVTKEIIENQIFKEQFIELYNKINGIVLLDNIHHGILCGDDKQYKQYFLIDGENVTTSPSSKKYLIKGSKSKLHYLIDEWNEKHPIGPKEINCTYTYNSDWGCADSNIALFIKCDYAIKMGLVKENSYYADD